MSNTVDQFPLEHCFLENSVAAQNQLSSPFITNLNLHDIDFFQTYVHFPFLVLKELLFSIILYL